MGSHFDIVEKHDTKIAADKCENSNEDYTTDIKKSSCCR